LQPPILRKTFSGFVESALRALGGIFWEAQLLENNRLAESVIAFRVQSLGLPQDGRNEQYLRLYEAMMPGILVDQVCLAINFSLPFLLNVR
jgi:hypothetical protein